MKTMLQGLLIAVAMSMGVSSAGTNQWTSVGPSGGSFSAVRYVGNGVAIATSLRGIYRTTDHGASWTRIAEITGNSASYGQTIAVDPSNNARVIVLGHSIIYCSSDRGLTWTQVNNVDGLATNTLMPRSISFSRNGGVAWLGAANSIFRSVDGGLTWTSRSNGIPTSTGIEVSQLGTGWGGTAIEYAQYYDAPYSTTDDGLHWNRLTLPMQVQTRRFAVSRHVAGTLLAYGNDGQPYRSTDFGATWTIAGAGQVDVVKYDAFTPGRAHAFGYDSTFRRTDNDGGNWVIRGNLPIQSPLDFDFDPTDANRVLAVSNATAIASSDGGISWTEAIQGVPEADVGRFAVSRGAAAALYAPTYGVQRAYRRDPATGAWNGIGTQLSAVLGVNYGAGAFSASPSDGNTIFMAGNGILARSLNGGATWSSVGNLPIDVTALIWDPSNELTGYAISANQGAMKTIDGGIHWTPCGTGLPGRITSLVVDPQDSNNLYATSDFGITGSVAVYRSINAGASWSPAANGIVPTFAWTLAFKPGNSAVLYAGTQDGLYKTVNAGVDWTRVGVAPSGGTVLDISIDPQNPDIVYAVGQTNAARSVDDGATWESLRMPSLGLNSDPLYLQLVPGQASLLAGVVRNAGIYEMQIAPDLELTTSAGAPLAIGIQHTILLRSRNIGEYAATSTRLSVALPEAEAGYTVNGNGKTCVVAARQLTCTLGILRSLATADITVAFTPVMPAQQVTAQLSAYEPDTVTNNNAVSVATERRADVRVALASSVTTRLTGERFTYTLTATNDGPSPADSVVATLQLPASVVYVSSTVAGFSCVVAAQTVTCNVATLAANANASAVINVDAGTVVGTAAATASLVSSGTDPLLTNNTAANSVVISAPPPPPPPPPPPAPTPTPTPTPRSSGGGGAIDYLLAGFLVLLLVGRRCFSGVFLSVR